MSQALLNYQEQRSHSGRMLWFARVDQRAHLTEVITAYRDGHSVRDMVKASVYVLADDPELSLDSRSVY